MASLIDPGFKNRPACPLCNNELTGRNNEYGEFMLYCTGDCDVRARRSSWDKQWRAATLELRRAKMDLHSYFDPMWRTKGVFSSRGAAYSWLASTLQCTPRMAHICHLTIAGCQYVKGALELL